MVGKIIDPDTRRKIASDYRKGELSTVEIAKKHGVSRRSVYNILGPKSKRRGMIPKVVKGAKLDRLATLNYRGYSDNRIAREMGLDQSTVTRHRNRLGLPVVPADARRN
jgi:DNA-binding CsgD family transcriptional regulator